MPRSHIGSDADSWGVGRAQAAPLAMDSSLPSSMLAASASSAVRCIGVRDVRYVGNLALLRIEPAQDLDWDDPTATAASDSSSRTVQISRPA